MAANLLQEFKVASGLSDEGIASLLSERAGRELSAEQVAKMRGRKEAPKYVLAALELDQEPPAGPSFSPDDPNVQPDSWRDDEPPAEPDRPRGGSDLEAVLPFDFDVAETRLMLVEAYKVAGKGAAYVGKNDEYERAFDLHAERCADSWIALARRDAKVAKVLASLTSGGAWGQLILIHLSLVMSMLVVAGKVQLPDTLPMAPGMGPSHDAARPEPTSANGAGGVEHPGSQTTPATA